MTDDAIFDDAAPEAAAQAMPDRELCGLIEKEVRQAIGVDDQTAGDREKALAFYLGEAKGDLAPPDVDTQSKVVSKDLMDTIEWAMPGLIEALVGEDVVSFQPDSPDDEQGAEDATNYVRHLLFERGPGFVTLYDAIKSCLMQRIGAGKVYCDHSHVDREERYFGVSQFELQALQADPEIEVVALAPGAPLPPQALPEGMPPELAQTFDVTAKRRETVKEYRCEGVPPEELRIAKDCRTLDKCRFIAHVVPRTRSALVSQGWPADQVASLPKIGASAEEDARHSYDGSQDSNDRADPSQEEVEVTEAYLEVDCDGDGVAEYRRVLLAGTYIHENDIVDDHPFWVFSPILMPYKLIGLSFYDLVEDLQRIKTALQRASLNNAYQVSDPRMFVEQGKVNLDDLLNRRNIVRRSAGTSPDVITPLETPYVGSQMLEMVNAIDQTRNTRTGVTETNSALNAEALSRGQVGSEGVQSLMQAGAQRQKLIARVLAETGLKRMYLLMLKLVTQYQDRPAQMKIAGRWLQVDPREWRTTYRISVKVGLGASEKAQDVANLQLIGMLQEKLIGAGLIAPQGVLYAADKLVKALGYPESDRFFPPAQPQPPAPDPKLQAEQAKQQGALQLEQIKQQGAVQLAQIQGQVDVKVEEMRQQFQAQQDTLAKQADMALADHKAQLDAQLEHYKAALKADTDERIARINAEARIEAAATMGAKDTSGNDAAIAWQEGHE